MKLLIKNPHYIFLSLAPVLFIIGYFSEKKTFDINIHDTYYVVEHGVVPTFISALFVIIGLGYWVILKAKARLSKGLSLIHITLTIGGLLLIRTTMLLYREPKPASLLVDYDFNNFLNTISFTIALIIIFSQIIFPINLIIGLMKRKT